MDSIDASYIALISAIIFGVAHFSGMPHGLIGMLKAGLLGWFLAKSVIEKQGIFWAWSIHFIQDVVIYIGFMINRVKTDQILRSSGLWLTAQLYRDVSLSLGKGELQRLYIMLVRHLARLSCDRQLTAKVQ